MYLCTNVRRRVGIRPYLSPVRYAYISQRGFYPDDREKANQDAYGVATQYDGDPNKARDVFIWGGVDNMFTAYVWRTKYLQPIDSPYQASRGHFG